jgi:hypothetical protein
LHPDESGRRVLDARCAPQLGGPIRFQNIAGKLPATPIGVRHAGPIRASTNCDILIGERGFAEAEFALYAGSWKMKAS